eukprot:9498685-Pyramimonas_sp.AAC.1
MGPPVPITARVLSTPQRAETLAQRARSSLLLLLHFTGPPVPITASVHSVVNTPGISGHAAAAPAVSRGPLPGALQQLLDTPLPAPYPCEGVEGGAADVARRQPGGGRHHRREGGEHLHDAVQKERLACRVESDSVDSTVDSRQ